MFGRRIVNGSGPAWRGWIDCLKRSKCLDIDPITIAGMKKGELISLDVNADWEEPPRKRRSVANSSKQTSMQHHTSNVSTIQTPVGDISTRKFGPKPREMGKLVLIGEKSGGSEDIQRSMVRLSCFNRYLRV